MIYAIRAVGSGFIKFGKANSVGKRLNELETASPYELELVAVAKWPDTAERAIHRILEAHNTKREWFRECPESEQVILWMHSNDLQSLQQALKDKCLHFGLKWAETPPIALDSCARGKRLSAKDAIRRAEREAWWKSNNRDAAWLVS